MSAKIFDGKGIAKAVRNEIAAEVQLIKASTGKIPGLAVLLVVEDPALAVYVRNKKRACEETCIRSISHNLPEETREEELLSFINTLNKGSGCKRYPRSASVTIPYSAEKKKHTRC